MLPFNSDLLNMAASTYYKLGLCPCGDSHSPFYLSVAKHGLPNGKHLTLILKILNDWKFKTKTKQVLVFGFTAFPGYYSIINSQRPHVITMRLDPNGYVKEPEPDNDYQKHVNSKHKIIINKTLQITINFSHFTKILFN